MRHLRLIAVPLAALSLVSCGLTEEQLQPTITRAEAERKVLSYDLDVRRTLLGGSQTEASARRLDSLECETADIPGPKGRVESSLDTQLVSHKPEGNKAVFDAFEQKVRALGFTEKWRYPDAVMYTSSKDEFAIGLTESRDSSKTLTLSVSSPCVWPDGTAIKE